MIYLLYIAKASLRALLSCFVLTLILPITIQALDLELIAIIDGDSTAEDMGYNVQSPGDMDGDGYSEVFVGSKVERFIKAFNGGHPADDIPEITYTDRVEYAFKWIDDINGDSYKDFATYKWTYGDQKAYEIYFGGPDFYNKTEPDMVFIADYQEGFSLAFCEDYDADGVSELMISAERPEWQIACEIFIYETGEQLDTIADDTLIFGRISYGQLVKCVEDINGDGYADFVSITGPNHKPGFLYIYFGNAEHDSIPDIQIWSPWDYAPGEGYFGSDIVTSDLNKDGYNDIIIPSTGFSHPPCIFYGGTTIDTIPKILEFPGDEASIFGDINHDGWKDIAVGYTTYDLGSGIVYIYYGSYDMDTICDITIPYYQLPAIAYHFGKSVGPAGDFNGDGVDDLVVGSDATINDNYNEGRMFIFAGDRNLPTPAEDEPDVPIPIDYDILKQNFPNPFNNSTVIEFSLHGISEREIELSIYNILGQKVRILFKGEQSGGTHFAYWDGKDDSGFGLPSGIYFYSLATDIQTTSKKMIYLK